MRGQEPAEQRPGDRGDAEDRSEDPLVAAALAGGDDVSERGLRAHDDAAAAQTLEAAEQDELRERPGQTAERRAHQEDHGRDLEHSLPPVEVAELSVERGRDSLREKVRGHDPGQVREPAELADDGRQSRRHDRRVERGEEEHQHEAAEDREPPLPRNERRRGFDRRRARVRGLGQSGLGANRQPGSSASTQRFRIADFAALSISM